MAENEMLIGENPTKDAPQVSRPDAPQVHPGDLGQEARSKLVYCSDTRGEGYDDFSFTLGDVLAGFGRDGIANNEVAVNEVLEQIANFDDSTGLPADELISAKLLQVEAFLNWSERNCKSLTDLAPADTPDNHFMVGEDGTKRPLIKYNPGGSTNDVWGQIRVICRRCGWATPLRPDIKPMTTADDELAALDVARNWIIEKLAAIAPTSAPTIAPTSDDALEKKRGWWPTSPVPEKGWHDKPLIGTQKELAHCVGVALNKDQKRVDVKTLRTMHGKSVWIFRVTQTSWQAYFLKSEFLAKANLAQIKLRNGTPMGADGSGREPKG